ncbi:porin [Suttonella indologenes]|uniref:Outer membrane porin protein 32 n=1 Tax=Suttonella indologenes TaxID=13276 RepID=A0A380MKN9_9GAMM|nr:porin [Suttonella indologenes]SUO91532.1 Outer membrane porin protein 32 precursor [Suttonella indologenes]
MKKALIALSVAAGMIASAQAENTTTLYGSLGVETQVNKNNTDSIRSSITDNRWNLDTSSAKFGIKGTEDLNNGLQAFYKIEFGFDPNGGVDKTRYAYLGLRGNFGEVTFGKQDSLYKIVTNKADIFQNSFYGETTHYGAATGGSQIPKVISYVSRNMNGFQFGLAGVLDGNHDAVGFSDNKSFSAYQAGIWYAQNGFYVGAAYSSLDVQKGKSATLLSAAGNFRARTQPFDNSPSIDVVGIAAEYKNDQFKVAISAEHKSGNDVVGVSGPWGSNDASTPADFAAISQKRAAERLAWSDGEKYALAGEYYSGPNTFRAGFGLADLNEFSSNIYTYGLGYQYNFSNRTYTYVEGEYIDWNVNNIKNGYTVRVGLRHDF